MWIAILRSPGGLLTSAKIHTADKDDAVIIANTAVQEGKYSAFLGLAHHLEFDIFRINAPDNLYPR